MTGARCVGKLHGFLWTPTEFVINTVCVVGDAIMYRDVAVKLLSAVPEMHGSDTIIAALNWVKPENTQFDEALRDAGFRQHVEKVYFRRSLTGYMSPYNDPFRYRSLAETGEKLFAKTLAEANEGSLSHERENKPPEPLFRSLIEGAGTAFDPTTWKVAYDGDTIAGIVLPQRFWDVPDEGTLFHIGLVPAYRRRGYGKVIHAHGLQLLSATGISGYVGSTEVGNIPMRAVFRANGCEEKGVRRIYRFYKSKINDGDDRIAIK